MTQGQLNHLDVIQKRQERRAQKRETRELRQNAEGVIDVIHASREHWPADTMWPFEKSALHRDQCGEDEASFLDEMDQIRRKKSQEGLRNESIVHVYNAVRFSFEELINLKSSEEERVNAARTILQTALLMAEISGADRRKMIQSVVDFCAEEMPLADIKKAYTKQLVARKPLLSPSDLERLGERVHD